MRIMEHLTCDNAIFAAKVAAGIVVTGAVIAGSGYLMQAGGDFLLNNPNIQSVALKTLGQYMKPAGEYVFLAGKYTTYTILVPAYTLGYELPKWVIKEGIPQAATLIHNYVIQPTTQALTYVKDHVLIPVMNKVIQVANDYLWSPLKDAALWVETKVVDVLTFARDHLLYPLGEKIYQIGKDYFFIPLRDAAFWMGRHIAHGLNQLNEYVLTPLKDAALWVATKVVDVLTFARDHLLYPLGEKICQVAKDYFFIPLRDAAFWMGRHIAHGLNQLNEYVLIPFVEIATKVSVWVRDNMLLPTINGVVNMFTYVAERVSTLVTTLFQHLFDYVLTPLGNVAQAVWNEVSEIALKILRYSWETIVMPVVSLIGTALTWTYGNLVRPIIYVASAIFAAISTQVVNVAKWGYSITSEVADLTYRIFQAIKNDIFALISGIPEKKLA